MLGILFCEDISLEYEFKSVKFKGGGGIDRLKNEQFRSTWKHNGIQNVTDAPTFASIYIDLYIRDGMCQNLSFVKHFGWEFLHGEPCCCLDVSIYLLKCLFCWDIVLENEFQRCVNLGRNINSSRWSLSKFVVSKHLWWEFLQGEPCFRLDISVNMLKCVFCWHILL